jgi:hypothetical protein
MREALINATEAAIRAVDTTRFFRTERGFHGRFYCAIQEQLDHRLCGVLSFLAGLLCCWILWVGK